MNPATTMKICATAAVATLLAGCQIFPPPELFIQRITMRHPNNPHALFVEGKSFLKEGQPEKAIGRFDEALRLQPNFLEAKLGLAHAYRETRRFARAARLYEDVLRAAPNNPQALEGLGLAAAHLNEPQRAESILLRALALDARSVTTLNALADLYYGQRQYRKALDYWQRSLNVDPTQESVRALVEDLKSYVAKYDPATRA